MSFRSAFLVSIVVVCAACTKSGSDDAVNPVSIPDKPVLTQTPSQPLTVSEYTQFKNFVHSEDGVTVFMPQTYLFAQLNETALTPDQKNVLAKIRIPGTCRIADTPTKAQDSQIKPGATMIDNDVRRVDTGACPIQYSLDKAMTLVVAVANQSVVAATGQLSIRDMLSVFDATMSPIIGTTQTMVDTKGNLAIIATPDNLMRIRLTATSTSSIAPLGTQNGHSETTTADLIMNMQQNTGQSSMKLAINVALTIPNMTKQIVVSFAVSLDSSSGGSPALQISEFYVNASPIIGADQSDLMNSGMLASVLTRILANGQISTGASTQMMKVLAAQ